MDPRSILVISVAMMLLNGAVLGLMHRSLPADVQPSAFSWRVGTLLVAGGEVLLAVQDFLPAAFVLPLANGMLALGVTGYWRAARQYMGLPETPWLLLPTAVLAAGIYWYSAVEPDLGARVVLASTVAAVLVFGAAWALRSRSARRIDLSHRVLAAILIAVGCFLVFRALYFALAPQAGSSSIDPRVVLNTLTFLVLAAVPVVGTTAFLLMCADRLRRDAEHAAATDYLTGLANRRTITRAGEALHARASARGEGYAVAVIDVDHFKSINDRHGHEVGDRALRHVASTLDRARRPGDALGRQGGEEFLGLLAGADAASAPARAEALRAAVAAAPMALVADRLPITVSIGLAHWRAGDAGFDDVLRRADQALYRAKAGGRNRVESDAFLPAAGD